MCITSALNLFLSIFAFLRKTYGYDLDYAWYFLFLLSQGAHIQLKINIQKTAKQTFLKNLSHISSHTRLIKICSFLKICIKKKMGKFNLWLFFDLKVKFKRYQNASLGREHNEMSRKKQTFPYAITIVAFNFCETFFILWKHNLLHPLLFHIIHDWVFFWYSTTRICVVYGRRQVLRYI